MCSGVLETFIALFRGADAALQGGCALRKNSKEAVCASTFSIL
jgi:hypothetical protein